MARVTLLTDFGTRDGYVGAMKGVLASSDPGLILDDISHDIPPGDIRKAAVVLARVWRNYPAGTVHLVVVDPGVGTQRRGLALEALGQFFVAPDNGVLSHVMASDPGWTCVKLLPSDHLFPPRSQTFHGRDLFAPVAGLLAQGTPLEELGTSFVNPMRLALPETPLRPGSRKGEIMEVDRFGNLATNLPLSDVESAGGVMAGDLHIPFRRTYGDVPSGELVSVLNSDGLVEVAVRDGSAEDRLGMGVGATIQVGTREG